MELRGTVAIVTGGAVRLGRSIALSLAEQGCALCIHYWQSAEAARETLDAIRESGARGVIVQADLRDPGAAARRIVASAVAEFGRVDVLVNSASIFEPGTLAETSEEAWDRHFAINLKAPFLLCREFAARLQPAQRAAIVNLADWRGLRPVPGHLAYTLTKSGLIALTRLLAQELAPRVQVNAVAPGAVLPPAGAGPDHLEGLLDEIPLARTGTPDEVTRAVLFLLQSEFVTGEVLHVTGGQEL